MTCSVSLSRASDIVEQVKDSSIFDQVKNGDTVEVDADMGEGIIN